MIWGYILCAWILAMGIYWSVSFEKKDTPSLRERVARLEARVDFYRKHMLEMEIRCDERNKK